MNKDLQSSETIIAGDKSTADFRKLYAEESSRYDKVRFTSARGIASMQVKNDVIVRTILSGAKSGKNSKIIDVASGTGRIVKHLLESGFEDITATDLTPEMMEKCEVSLSEDESQKVNFQVADMIELPFPDETFDVATMGSFLYLISAADYEKFTSDVYRILRPGGILICEVSNSWAVLSPRNILAFFKRTFLGKKDSKSYVNPIEVKSLFGEFKLIERIGVDYPLIFRKLDTHKKMCKFLGSSRPMSLMGGKMTLILEK